MTVIRVVFIILIRIYFVESLPSTRHTAKSIMYIPW